MVPDHPVRPGFDQGRPFAGPGAADGLLGRLPHGQHVVAVDRDAGDAVGRGLAGHVNVSGGHRQRCGGGIEVVFADEDQRGVLDAGEIDRLVKRPVVDGPVAEEGHGYLVGSTDLGTYPQSHGPGQPAADDPVGSEQPIIRGEQMHRAATAAADTRPLAEQLRQDRPRRNPFGQGVSVTAVGAGDPIVATQMRDHPHGRCLLANVQVDESGKLTVLVKRLYGLLEPPQKHHLPIQFQQLLVVQLRRNGGDCGLHEQSCQATSAGYIRHHTCKCEPTRPCHVCQPPGWLCRSDRRADQNPPKGPPSDRKPRLRHTAASIVSAKKFTLPSHSRPWTPPGWRLRAAAVLVILSPGAQGRFSSG